MLIKKTQKDIDKEEIMDVQVNGHCYPQCGCHVLPRFEPSVSIQYDLLVRQVAVSGQLVPQELETSSWSSTNEMRGLM